MPSTTITYTAQEGAKLAWAFGRKLQLGQDATAAQVKADLIEYATNVYKNQKRIEAEEAGASETVEIT